MSIKEVIKKLIPCFLIDWYHFSLAFLGAVIYGFPSKKIKVIGITGTNGKSTVVNLTTKILEKAGSKTASLSSIKFKIGDKEWINTLKMTMPGRLKLQKFLRQAVNNQCQYVVLEVTSEGIKQYRHKFIAFDAAVFTNLTPEHIESHGSFENYKKAKGKLFKAAKKIHIINLDDNNTEYFLQFPAEKKIGFTLQEKNIKSLLLRSKRLLRQIIKAENCQLMPDGLKFSVNDIDFNLNLLGKFNISNSLAAICAGLSQGISLEKCKSALEKIKGIPGRMEIVMEKPFTVIVDYAHTPDALEKVYQTIQAQKVICVLGAAGGGRDKWKRPELGKIAAKYCNEIILTNEDPYDESPMEIINQIAEGVKNIGINQHKSAVYKILDRKEAIKKALSLAKPGDVVIITGKGCEPRMCVAKGIKIAWDDREIVKQEFKKLK